VSAGCASSDCISSRAAVATNAAIAAYAIAGRGFPTESANAIATFAGTCCGRSASAGDVATTDGLAADCRAADCCAADCGTSRSIAADGATSGRYSANA